MLVDDWWTVAKRWVEASICAPRPGDAARTFFFRVTGGEVPRLRRGKPRPEAGKFPAGGGEGGEVPRQRRETWWAGNSPDPLSPPEKLPLRDLRLYLGNRSSSSSTVEKPFPRKAVSAPNRGARSRGSAA